MRHGLIVLFGILSATFASWQRPACQKPAAGYIHKVQTYSFANIDKFSSSSIVTRLTTDVANLQNAFQVIIRMAIRCGMMLILSLTMALRISPRLCLIYCVVMPLLACGLFFVIGKVRRIFDRVFKTYDRLNNVVQENLHGIRVVKSFVREEQEKEKFSQVSRSIFRDFVKAEHILAFNNPMMQTAAYTCMLLISWFGAKMVLASGDNGALGLTTGQLSSMFTYTQQILGSLMMLSMVFVMITMSRAAGQRAVELLKEVPDLASPANPVTQVADGSIDFENVSFRYSKEAKRDALEGVTLHIRSGMTVGILGGTGSSKSTLVQLIPRLYDATQGVVKVGGIDVRQYDLEVLRDQVAMVLQKNVLFSGTIADNLRWGNPRPPRKSWSTPAAWPAPTNSSKAPDGYETHIEQGGANVSGGQKQRLCIARALLKNPDSHSGRLHLRRGHRHRRQNPPGLPGGNSGHHQAHHRPAGGLGGACGPDPGAGRRADCGPGDSYRAPEPFPHLPGGLSVSAERRRRTCPESSLKATAERPAPRRKPWGGS